MLRGDDASDDHPELVRLETEDDVEKLIARVQAQGGHPLGSAAARLVLLMPPRGAPGGSGQRGTRRERPAHRAPRHRPGGSRERAHRLVPTQARFTPAFRAALDALFDRLARAPAPPRPPAPPPGPGEGTEERAVSEASDGMATSEEEIADTDLATSEDEMVISEASALAWLELVNRELGRGGTNRGDCPHPHP